MENGIDYLKVENAAGELERAINLNQLLSEELEDMYELTVNIAEANTKQELLDAKDMLAVQMQNRLDLMVTLNSTSDDIVRNQKSYLMKLDNDYLAAMKANKNKKGNYDEK